MNRLLGGDRNCRWQNLGGGSGPLGRALEGYASFCPFPSLLPGCHKAKAFLCHTLPPGCSCLTPGLEAMEPDDYGLKSLKPRAKINFSFFVFLRYLVTVTKGQSTLIIFQMFYLMFQNECCQNLKMCARVLRSFPLKSIPWQRGGPSGPTSCIFQKQQHSAPPSNCICSCYSRRWHVSCPSFLSLTSCC